MPSEELRKAVERILEGLEKEALELLDRGLDNGRKILEKTFHEALREAEKVLKEADAKAREEARTRLSKASMEAKRARLKAQEKAIESAIEAFTELIKKSRNEDWYREALARMIKEGVEAVGEGAILRPAEPDYDVVRELVTTLGVNVTVGEPVRGSIGGVILVSPDGTAVYDNTIEARLRRHRRELRKALARVLFEG